LFNFDFQIRRILFFFEAFISGFDGDFSPAQGFDKFPAAVFEDCAGLVDGGLADGESLGYGCGGAS